MTFSWQGGGRPATPPAPPQSNVPAETRILFIGNSLTQANDLPALVTTLARSAGRRVTCEMVAAGGFSLDDHLQQGDALKAIRRGGWTFVVLQQGPSSLAESQAQLRESTKRFDIEIRKAGARTALYMVWPELARKQMFDAVSRSYTNAAADINGLLLPVGDTWREAWKRDPALALYGPDDFHPSAMGTYLAALVVVHKLLGISPAGLSSPGIPADKAKVLQEAARVVS